MNETDADAETAAQVVEGVYKTRAHLYLPGRQTLGGARLNKQAQ